MADEMRKNSQIKTGKSMRTVKRWNRDPERLQNLYPQQFETPNWTRSAMTTSEFSVETACATDPSQGHFQLIQ